MDAHYCCLCLGVDCFGGKCPVSSGSLPDDLHLELSVEGFLRLTWDHCFFLSVDKCHTPPERTHSACLALRGFGSKLEFTLVPVCLLEPVPAPGGCLFGLHTSRYPDGKVVM